jgi:hypothetical protein
VVDRNRYGVPVFLSSPKIHNNFLGGIIMAKVEVKFSVTPDDNVRAYWIAVGNDDIPLINGKGSIFLDEGQTYFLVWWFAGNSGGTIKIKGETISAVVIKDRESKIPKAQHEGAGTMRFSL